MQEPDPTPRTRPAPRGPVDDLVQEVLDGEPAALRERLEEACRRHPDEATLLRRRVDVLIEAGFVDPGKVEVPELMGDFRLVEPIGQGGMGIVYRARQESLGREVAVKLIRPEELRFPGARERFAREVTTIASLSHPGIVPVYAVGEEGGVPYFAMELVRGATLARLLVAMKELAEASGTSGAPVTRGADLDQALARVLGEQPAAEPAPLFRGTWEQTALRIVRAVADALDHAHSSSILHRDVKPSNIMLTRDGRVMLLDFGLSSFEGSERLTRTGVQVGSFAYMAPELLTETAVADRRSDVYALGVTLYELLAGQLPYSARSLAALRTRVLEARPRSLRRDRRRRVSWEAETVCLVAMDIDRRRRYSSAGEVARDLDNILASRPILARRPGLVLRTRRFAERHPAWTVAALLLMIAVPVTWAIGERVARVQLSRANAALADSLEEVQRQEARADGNFVLARGAVDRMLDRLGDVRLRDVPHLETLRRDVLKDALAFHEALVEAEPENLEERLEYVRSLERVADMHGLLSEFDEVAETLSRAWRSLEEMIAGNPDERYVDELAQVAWRLVEAENFRGRLEEALSVGRQARELLVARGLDRALNRQRLARLDVQLAGVLQRAGEVEEAREFLEHSVEDLRELRANGELVGDGMGLLATALTELGQPQAFLVHGDTGGQDHEVQTDYLREALDLRRAIAKDTGTPDSRFALVESLIDLGATLFARSEYDAAIEANNEARVAVEELVQDYPSVTTYLDARAAISLNSGSQYSALGQLERAEESFARSALAYAELHRLRPDQRGLGVRRLIALQSLIDTRVSLERVTSDLLAQLDEADALAKKLARTETGQGTAVVARLAPFRTLMRGKILVQLGRIDDAVDLARSLADAVPASPEPLLQAASLLAHCTGADLPADHAEELAFEALDTLARALDLTPASSLVDSYLETSMFDPLHPYPALTELLESHGLERVGDR